MSAEMNKVEEVEFKSVMKCPVCKIKPGVRVCEEYCETSVEHQNEPHEGRQDGLCHFCDDCGTKLDGKWVCFDHISNHEEYFYCVCTECKKVQLESDEEECNGGCGNTLERTCYAFTVDMKENVRLMSFARAMELHSEPCKKCKKTPNVWYDATAPVIHGGSGHLCKQCASEIEHESDSEREGDSKRSLNELCSTEFCLSPRAKCSGCGKVATACGKECGSKQQKNTEEWKHSCMSINCRDPYTCSRAECVSATGMLRCEAQVCKASKEFHLASRAHEDAKCTANVFLRYQCQLCEATYRVGRFCKRDHANKGKGTVVVRCTNKNCTGYNRPHAMLCQSVLKPKRSGDTEDGRTPKKRKIRSGTED
jgi:hypothetical protein